MALGDFNLFSFKSKEQSEREQEEYNEWAFPHGPKQRENFEQLLRELLPKVDMPFALMGFLTCKELYERYLKKLGSSEQAVEALLNKDRGYKGIIKKKEMPRCIALVLADAQVDESCLYPSADELRNSIEKIEAMQK